MEPHCSLDDAVFTYFVATDPYPGLRLKCELVHSGLIVSHTEGTVVLSASTDHESVCVIGLCVDSHAEISREEIPQYLVSKNAGGVHGIVRATKRLAGRFAIIYCDGETTHVLGDATGSLSVFYDVKSPVCLSSSDELIRKHRGYDVSNDVVALRERIGYARPLPNDVTVCDNIRALLPNHYLNATACAVTRFFPTRDTSLRHGRRQPLEIGNLIDRCIERVERITREYAKHADIVCPLSSGTDSRANLAILKLYVPNLACYTFRHPGFTDQTGDYYIPPKLCELTGLSHISIDDLTAPTQYVNSVREIVGQYHSQSTINLAYTLNSTLRGKTLIDGNILQYVAKAVIGYTLPPQLATTRLFVERYNGGSRILTDIVSAWVQDIRDNGCHNEIFDLFGVESSCGRWGAQTSAIYAATGVATLSIFNCIDVIEDLMQIPARLRRDNIVHRRILTKLAPELASLPFNPGQKTLTLRLRMSAPYTLFAPYAKQFRRKLTPR